MSWQELLNKAVAESSRSAVARQLGVSRTAISLLCAGKYPGGPGKMAQRIFEEYGRIRCPYLGRGITPAECNNNSGRMPTSSPVALKLWRACQQCKNKQNQGSTANE